MNCGLERPLVEVRSLFPFQNLIIQFPMARSSYRSRLTRLPLMQAGALRLRILCRFFWAIVLTVWAVLWPNPARAAILWSQAGPNLVHETGVGANILGGALRRDD